MNEYPFPVQVRWSDLDPNFHLRHSVYYDWGAYCRMRYFNEHGLTGDVMQKLNTGPIIFREECVFRKEIKFGDAVTIDVAVINARKDFSRWSLCHRILKNKEVLSAVLTLDMAWLNITERKLAVPAEEICKVIDGMPKDNQFEWLYK